MTEIRVAKSPYVVGIDLGTSNSAITVFIKGQAEIIPIDGSKTLPSVFGVRNGEILVGRQARNRLMIDPENTVVSIKREIGSNWKKQFEGLPNKEYTPTDISAEILSKLVSGAVEAGTVDLRGHPCYTVICIPANFNDAQKVATIEAAKLANLEVLYLLEEPVAAAIAYGLEKERDQTILVYDLGGGTFDVSILQIDSTKGEREFRILAKEGIHKLGGDDFDLKIMEMAAEKLAQVSGIELLNLEKDQGINKKSLRQAQQKLKDAAETAKWELSEAQTARLDIPNLIKDESGNVHNLEMEITRAEFNESIREQIAQSKEAVERALASVKRQEGEPFTIEDIDRIILVGGSTRIPLVKEMLTQMFGKEPYSDTDPDTAIARGAAIFAATLNVPSSDLESLDPNDKPDGEFKIFNIVTHFLGIEVTGGKFSCLINKGLEISPDAPLVHSENYTTHRDNMSELSIRVYQSDREVDFIRQEEGVECIGEFFISILPKPAGEEKIEITFAINQQNLLKVTATSSSSAGELEIQRS
jgi:molecular chaperone DnaK (HSP70)